MRRSLASGEVTPALFRAALTSIAAVESDVWVDRVFGLDDLPSDGPELPRGCVPYLPCAVERVLRALELAEVQASDVFVDVGSGVGRATALAHLVTGAEAIGIEVQPELVRHARALAERLNAPRVSVIEGDAAELVRQVTSGTVFFLYCPFSGARLERVLSDLRALARTRPIRVCCADLPLPVCSWLGPVSVSGDLAVYESREALP
jgi:SAM-dependent methyltransferase